MRNKVEGVITKHYQPDVDDGDIFYSWKIFFNPSNGKGGEVLVGNYRYETLRAAKQRIEQISGRYGIVIDELYLDESTQYEIICI